MSVLLIAKIIHIMSAILFMGCVFFRTFISPALKSEFGKDSYQNIEFILSKASRKIGIKNVFLLFLSGLYLFYYYFDVNNVLLNVKAILGMIIIITFYLAPFFVHKISQKYSTFKRNFHLILFMFMIIIVLLSQIMFS